MIAICELSQLSEEQRDKIVRRAEAAIEDVRSSTQEIIEQVRNRGDAALVEFTQKWDDPSYELAKLVVTELDIREAYANTPPESIERIKQQIALSTKFHNAQRERIADWEQITDEGICAGEKWTAIEAVGLYVPGGKNPFPTVQQILAVPAKIAGCERIVSCISPREKNYEVLIAANEVGISEIYRVSGPQAIAALAYGTETIKAVELIAGPGNPYVTAAKILCQNKIAIDMPAGPSEAIILADQSTPTEMSVETKAAYCAADILARAEHGPDSAGVLVTNSPELAELTKQEVVKQFAVLSRQDYVREALATYSAIVLTETMAEAIDFTNEYAPEHLELLTEDPRETLQFITNAGSVFLGYYNPVATGDYASGVNHVLPTGSWAKRTSPVGVWTFMKRVQYSEVSKAGLEKLQPIVRTISDIEGLDAHKKSVDIRFEATT